ncbi:hypothetical protein [Morganella psychrotolerans]|uniref:hypothetical protein n=1 Tax=Morganella psychrotolerans TaxID=368603 RepID=UPI0039AFEE8B
MKKIVLLIGVLLGIAGSSLYFWMKPQTDDPYFFLSPKITEGHPVSMPIELYKQGATVDFIFWVIPMPEPTLLYIFPANYPSIYAWLEVKREQYGDGDFYTRDIFTKKGLVELQPNIPLLKMTLYKINSDLTESLVTEEIQLYNSVQKHRNFLLASIPNRDYGQYRLKVTVLGDWPELNKDGFKYFITIKTSFTK